MTEQFWNSPNMEPKRNYKFEVSVQGIKKWIVKDFQRPTYSMGEGEHNYLNHKFYYPGIVEWDTVDFTIVDPIDQNAVELLKNIIRDSGYKWIDPNHQINPNDQSTVSKSDSVAQLGEVIVRQIDSDGNPVDEWKLVNAWVKEINYSDLAYDNEDLSDITLTLRYDYATSEGLT